jgi:hypothetical protein
VGIVCGVSRGVGLTNAGCIAKLGCCSSVVEHFLGKEEVMGSSPISSSCPVNRSFGSLAAALAGLGERLGWAVGFSGWRHGRLELGAA